MAPAKLPTNTDKSQKQLQRLYTTTIFHISHISYVSCFAFLFFLSKLTNTKLYTY